jgi:hypothetical protein
MKHLVGKQATKPYKFMGSELEISKLTVSQVMAIQTMVEAEGTDQMEILRTVVNSSVKGASELTDAEFKDFPVEDLTMLSNEIMKFSGMGNDKK